jgi:hypothetical protein
MISHDQLIYAINSMHPELQHGQDFLVAHGLDERGNQAGPAFILQWKAAVERPDDATLYNLARRLSNEYEKRQVRAIRDALIAKTDWTQSPDVPDAVREKWLPYRQALRDVSSQPGFPLDVVWPTPPEE